MKPRFHIHGISAPLKVEIQSISRMQDSPKGVGSTSLSSADPA
jgi:hypothetical protein